MEFIIKATDEKGFPPTFKEIGEGCGMSSLGAYDHMKRLRKKGYVDWFPLPRTIHILKEI